MTNKILILFVFVSLLSCGNKSKSSNTAGVTGDATDELNAQEATTIVSETQTVPILNYEELAPLLNKKEDKTYVVNFWATWCKPCVEELPYFENIHSNYEGKNVEVLLVSLDFPKQINDQLVPFITNNKLQSEVVVLDDPDQNKWINAIDPSWSGSIPATIIYNKNKRAFYEQSFDEQTLETELNKFLN